MLKHILLVGLLSFSTLPLLKAQSCGNDEKYHLPYKNTYVKEPLVTENEYRVAKPETIVPKSFEEARQILPNPIWGGHDKELEMYWKAWEIAIGNIRAPQAGSGFVSSYLDTAYNGNIFMWDSSFILMFARYGTRFFPFQNTLNNFYAKQHPDGFICREIKADGADCFERYDPVSTGPNLMPWCEMVYFHQFGDTERLHKIFPVLCAYYKWLKLNHTWRNGTYWSSGWGTGMDNMPRVPSEYSPIYSHGHMIWLDTNLQQLFTANLLLEMGFYLERWQEIEEFEDEAKMLGKYIHDNLWDEKTGFLYDQYADGTLCTTKGIGAYWALFTDVLDSVQLDRMVKELDNPATFNRKHRIPSLSADNPKYKENGRYWQGGVWPGTNYMVMQGLVQKGIYHIIDQSCINQSHQRIPCTESIPKRKCRILHFAFWQLPNFHIMTAVLTIDITHDIGYNHRMIHGCIEILQVVRIAAFYRNSRESLFPSGTGSTTHGIKIETYHLGFQILTCILFTDNG